MPRRALTALLAATACVALAPSPATASTCADADLAVTSATVDRAAAAVRCLVDAERTTRGLAPLRANDLLDRAGLLHGIDMVLRDFFAHDAPSPAPNGESPGDRIAATGYRAWAWGENLAAGYPTPRSAMRGWMASEGHCRNVLNPDVTELGVGIVVPDSEDGRRAMVHWVQQFGLPEGTEPNRTGSDPQAACPVATLAAGPVAYVPPAAAARDGDGADAVETDTGPVVRWRARRVAGGRVRVTGTVHRRGATRRVRIQVRRADGRRTIARTVRLRAGGRFTATLRAPRGSGALRVRLVLR